MYVTHSLRVRSCSSLTLNISTRSLKHVEPASPAAATALPPVPERRPSVNSGATKFPVPVAPAVAMAAAVKKAPEVSATSGSYASPSSAFFPYETLRGAFPSSVDPTKKEEYLDDSTFQQLFGECIEFTLIHRYTVRIYLRVSQFYPPIFTIPYFRHQASAKIPSEDSPNGSAMPRRRS